MSKPAIRGVTGTLQNGGLRTQPDRRHRRGNFRYTLEERESEIVRILQHDDLDPLEEEELEMELIFDFDWTEREVDNLLGRTSK